MSSAGSRRAPDALRVSAVHWSHANGTHGLMPYIHHGGTALCACIDASGRVLVVKQYRPLARATILELPGGRVIRGERPVDAAVRETEEETGIHPLRAEPLGAYFSSVGLTNERIHVFTSSEFTGSLDPERGTIAVWMPLADLTTALDDGALVDAKTALAVALVARRLGR